jgi:Uma2 family endonuclease
MKQLVRDDSPERMSLSDFLAWEEAQPLRHERVGGQVRAMTGGTLGHNRIGLNVYSALRARLAGSGCEAFALDVRVVTPGGDVMYPDVVVACGERRNTERQLADPVVLVEVLSPSTAERDDSFKRWAYSTIPSLKHYVLIAQNRAEAEVSTADGETWRSVILRDAEQSLRLEALGLEIPLAEVF